jgi:hypothetical protein
MTVHNRTIRLRLLLGVGLAALALQACDKPAQTGAAAVTSPPPGALPLDASGLPPAPAPAAMAPAPPAPIAYVQAPRQRYRYVDRAAAMNGAFADSPPDYTVDYDGSRPWIWRARDGSRRVVEHTEDGDRYYYYDPGSDEPYLVRGPDYTYGYDQGRLAVVYDSQGRALDDAEAEARAERAGEYLARARQLYYAADHQRHEAATAAAWQAQRDAQFAQERQWEADQQNQADWRAWHEQNAYAPPVYAQEHGSRVAYAATIGAVAAGALVAAHASAQNDARRPGFVQPTVQSGNPYQGQQAARQQQAEADHARQSQQAAQANAIDTARRQQAQADDARQAQVAQQQRAQEQHAQAANQQAASQARLDAAHEQAMRADAARQTRLNEAHAATQQQAQARAQAQTQAQAAREAAAHQQQAEAAQHQQQAQASAARAQADAARAAQAADRAKAAHVAPAPAAKPAPAKPGPAGDHHPGDRRPGDHNPQP